MNDDLNDSPLFAPKALGQHIWLDDLSRTLIADGALQRLITEDGIDGVTSNPAILQQAIADSPCYADDLERLRVSPLDATARYESLVIPDIQAACDLLWPAYESSAGETGYVSLEVSPALAQHMAATEAEALRLRQAVGRDNLLVKVPATAAGIRAFEQLTATGLRVNATLICSLAQYEAVVQAYLCGAQRWLDGGGAASQLRSVASVFLSRVDTLVDQRLDAAANAPAQELKGKSGVALAKCCYGRYLEIFHGSAFARLGAAGVRPQTPLWASTGTKNPAYSDLLYVEALIGAETINTLPQATLTAFRDHGRASSTLASGIDAAQAHFAALALLGIDPVEVGETLQAEGVRRFAAAYDCLATSA